MFKNNQGITDITMYGITHLFCPLGNDFYTANTTIKVNEPKMIPDYCDVTKFFGDIDGKSLIIEDACKKVLEFVKEQTKEALSITVTIDVDDARHLPVSVTISD
jgi:hypothetical protein